MPTSWEEINSRKKVTEESNTPLPWVKKVHDGIQKQSVDLSITLFQLIELHTRSRVEAIPRARLNFQIVLEFSE